MEIKELQQYIRQRDYRPELKNVYFLKLIEEVGELAEAINNDSRMTNDEIKGTIEEELYDVLYYICGLANCYDIDLEKCHKLKSQLNNQKWYSKKV